MIFCLVSRYLAHVSPPTDLASEVYRAWFAGLGGRHCDMSIELRAHSARVAGLNAKRRHYAASTFKLALLCAVLDDAHASPGLLDRSVVVRAEFAGATGDGFELSQSDDQDDATWSHLGRSMPLSALIEPMITRSSNIATNLVLAEVGLPFLNSFLTAHGLASDITVNRLIGDGVAERRGLTNVVTARGLACLMDWLAEGVLLPPDATEFALRTLAAQEHRRMIPAGLPPGTWIASKGGWVAGVKHDVAHVRPPSAPAYSLAICTTSVFDDVEGESLVADLSAATWKVWTQWYAS